MPDLAKCLRESQRLLGLLLDEDGVSEGRISAVANQLARNDYALRRASEN